MRTIRYRKEVLIFLLKDNRVGQDDVFRVRDFAQTAITNGEVYEIKISDPLPPRQIYVAKGADLHSKAADELLNMIASR